MLNTGRQTLKIKQEYNNHGDKDYDVLDNQTGGNNRQGNKADWGDRKGTTKGETRLKQT